MIIKNGKIVFQIINNSLNISKVYHGAQLVWRTVYNAIKSCYGSGVWLQDKLWIDNDTWKNN